MNSWDKVNMVTFKGPWSQISGNTYTWDFKSKMCRNHHTAQPYLCVVHCMKPPNQREGNTLHTWLRRCWYLQTASSGKAQLLLKERNKGDYSGAHFQPKRWRSTVLYVKLLFKWLTNRGHCDTALHELTYIQMIPIVLYCLKGFSHWPCMSLFGAPVSSTSSHEGQRRVNISIMRFWRCRFKCSK